MNKKLTAALLLLACCSCNSAPELDPELQGTWVIENAVGEIKSLTFDDGHFGTNGKVLKNAKWFDGETKLKFGYSVDKSEKPFTFPVSNRNLTQLPPLTKKIVI